MTFRWTLFTDRYDPRKKIIVRTDYERDALELLKKQLYGHAKQFDTEFLMMTGLRQDMNRTFTAVG